MDLEKIIPAIALIAVLILVLPGFIKSNSRKKLFFKNLSIWAIIIFTVMIILTLINKWEK